MIFVDTGFFYALASAKDPDHDRVVEVFETFRNQRLSDVLLTTNHVVFETIELAREILMRNRFTSVVAFGFGKRDCVEAWIRQRASTLQAEELIFYVGQLAREADRFEYLLTGKDIY